jgi:hypothetical protein
MLLAPYSCSVVSGAHLNDFELAHHVQMHDFPLRFMNVERVRTS